MDINLLFKIAAIGILVAVLHQVLVRAGREDQAMMTTLAGLVIVLTMVIKEISGAFFLKNLQGALILAQNFFKNTLNIINKPLRVDLSLPF